MSSKSPCMAKDTALNKKLTLSFSRESQKRGEIKGIEVVEC
jgi:hypothetical protein